MKKLHIDNYPELLQWCKENLPDTRYEVYKDTLTIHCKDSAERSLFREQTNKVRTPEHKL